MYPQLRGLKEAYAVSGEMRARQYPVILETFEDGRSHLFISNSSGAVSPRLWHFVRPTISLFAHLISLTTPPLDPEPLTDCGHCSVLPAL